MKSLRHQLALKVLRTEIRLPYACQHADEYCLFSVVLEILRYFMVLHFFYNRCEIKWMLTLWFDIWKEIDYYDDEEHRMWCLTF